MRKYLKNTLQPRNIISARYRAKWKAMTEGRCDQQSLCARQAASLIVLLQRALRSPPPTSYTQIYDNNNFLCNVSTACCSGSVEFDLIDSDNNDLKSINKSYHGISSNYNSSSCYNNNNNNKQKSPTKTPTKIPSYKTTKNDFWDMEKEGLSDVCVQQVLAILDSDTAVAMQECSVLALETIYEALLQAMHSANMQHEQELASLVIQTLEVLENKVATKYACNNNKSALRDHEQIALLKHMGKGVELLKLQNKMASGL